MSVLCSLCNKVSVQGTEETEDFIFMSSRYPKLMVWTRKSGFICKSCFMKSWNSMFEEYMEFLEVTEENKVKVLWGKYAQKAHDHHACWQEEFYGILKSIRVLSCVSIGGWDVVVHGRISANPTFREATLYFRDHNDAIAYAKLMVVGHHNVVEVRHIDETISKDGILAWQSA